MGRYLRAIRSGDFAAALAEKPTEATQAAYVGNVGSLLKIPRETQSDRGTPFDALHQRINQAGDWQQLYVILTDADLAYVHGKVTGDDVDDLCDAARQASKTLPENPPWETER